MEELYNSLGRDQERLQTQRNAGQSITRLPTILIGFVDLTIGKERLKGQRNYEGNQQDYSGGTGAH